MKEFKGRQVVINVVVGSHNYNLNTSESDVDYKYFIAPSFDDLYTSNMVTHNEVGKDVDYSVHDVRKLSNVLWKSNINFIEVLFSKAYIINTKLNALLDNKESIARMNLPYLFDACMGMHNLKMGRLNKSTAGTEHLLEKYGYNTKEATHAYRLPDFLCRYYKTDFMSFKEAIWYEGESRDTLLSIKSGEVSRADFEAMVKVKVAEAEALKKIYNIQAPDLVLKDGVEGIIKEFVKQNLK